MAWLTAWEFDRTELNESLKPSRIIPESVISGPRSSVVFAVHHYSSSATSAADATDWYGLLIAVGGVSGDVFLIIISSDT